MKGIIALTGFMGSGKTTRGRAMALEEGCPFLDLDEYIEERTGRKVAEIFSASGEEGFRDEESRCLREILSRDYGDGLVLALGGGTILRKENLDLVKSRATVIYLDVAPDVLEARLKGSEGSRPLLRGRSVADMIKERRPLYEAAADIIISE